MDADNLRALFGQPDDTPALDGKGLTANDAIQTGMGVPLYWQIYDSGTGEVVAEGGFDSNGERTVWTPRLDGAG